MNVQSYKFMVSIDFGTTFSGSCYIDTTRKDTLENLKDIKNDIKNVQDINNNSTKIPTASIYTRDYNRYLREWGFEAQNIWKEADETYEKTSIYLEKFKLHIDELSDMDALAFSDFLSKMNEMTLSHMTLNAGLSSGDENSIRYILTVPAQWSQENRDKMRELAVKAGLVSEKDHPHRLQIINESLAATLYCENEIEYAFEPGFRYLICDAGGGTVDIATYETTQINDGRIERCQLTTDSSKNCSSAVVDKKMQELLIEILFQPERKRDYKMFEQSISKPLEQFVHKKVCLYGSERDLDYIEEFGCVGYRFDIGMLDIKTTTQRHEGFYFEDPETLVISSELICQKVFEPVVNDIMQLIEFQLQKSNEHLDAIFLLGGFGKSPYLLGKTKERFSKQLRKHHVLNDAYGDLAAMRGALYYGLEELHHPQVLGIKTIPFYTSTQFPRSNSDDVLVCIDISYELTTIGCYKFNRTSYKLLHNTRLNTSLTTSDYNLKSTLLNCVDDKDLIFKSQWETVKDEFEDRFERYLSVISDYLQHIIPGLTNNCGMTEYDGDDSQLLLINREDASALYFQSSIQQQDYFLHRLLQINVHWNHCRLSLYESIAIPSSTHRNIRKIKSATFQFDLIDCMAQHARLSFNIDGDSSAFKKELIKLLHTFKKGVTHFVSMNLSITAFDFVEKLLKPALKDLLDNLMQHISPITTKEQYAPNEIYLLGCLFEQTMSDLVMKTIHESLVMPLNPSNRKSIVNDTYMYQEAYQGAVIYGLNPGSYSKRISRKTYAVRTIAFQQSEKSSSTKNDFIADQIQMNGIRKRFFTAQPCTVYATLYSSESNEIRTKNMVLKEENNTVIEAGSFKKLHQFVIQLEQKVNHPRSRPSFQIKMLFSSYNQVRFIVEVQGKRLFEFRERDDFLVTAYNKALREEDDKFETQLKKNDRHADLFF